MIRVEINMTCIRQYNAHGMNVYHGRGENNIRIKGECENNWQIMIDIESLKL